MRRYANFLGYSAAEGGVVEIFTDDTFSMGMLDLYSGERDFDDFEFTVPDSSVFKVLPQNNSSYRLMTSLEHDTTVASFVGLTSLTPGVKLWIENERITIGSNVSGIKWNITRAINNSIAIKHLSTSTPGGSSALLTVSTKRVSPIGLIVKITDEVGLVHAYGQITEMTKVNSGSVTIKCKSIYKQLETPIVTQQERECNISTLISGKYNEFFALMRHSDVLLPNHAQTEIVDELKVLESPKDFIEQLLNLSNCFVGFDKSLGLFNVYSMARVPLFSDIEQRLLGDYITNNNGVYDVSLKPPVSSIVIKTKDYERTICLSDSNFINSYNGSSEVSIDASAILLPPNQEAITLLNNLAYYKMFVLNSITEHLVISAQRWSQLFNVGKYYRFTDIYKFPSFTTEISSNVYFCTGVSDTQVQFIRTDLFVAKQVAPAFTVKKTDTQTYTLENVDDFIDYVQSRYDSLNSLEYLRNRYTGDLVFEEDDKITLIDIEGDYAETTLTSVGNDYITTVGDIGSVGDVFIMTIELWKGGSIALKNNVYLYDTNTEVL